MERAGMVHALETIQQLLKPGGILLDIHPTNEPAAIAVRPDDQKVTLARGNARVNHASGAGRRKIACTLRTGSAGTYMLEWVTGFGRARACRRDVWPLRTTGPTETCADPPGMP